MSRAISEVARSGAKKKRFGRDAKTTRRIRAREETRCERRDVGRAVPFRGGFRRRRPPLVFSRFFSFGSFSLKMPSSSSLHKQQQQSVVSTIDQSLLLRENNNNNNNRVYVRGVILGYKRARTNQHENTSLIKLENVPDKASTAFYLGKKLCYVYKAHTKKQGTVYRTMWGKVTRAHGTSGVVRAKFKHNLPPSSIGGKIRCMLYPSNI